MRLTKAMRQRIVRAYRAETYERQRARIRALEAGLDRAIKELVAMRDTFYEGICAPDGSIPNAGDAEELAEFDALIDALKAIRNGSADHQEHEGREDG